jgi:putative transposase
MIIDYLERRLPPERVLPCRHFVQRLNYQKDGKVIEVHPAIFIQPRWIGVDLNTTGHVAVAAEPVSGKVMKLGKNIHYNHSHSLKNCTKLWKEGKLWKLKKYKTRERKNFKTAINTISRQIVSFAESLGSGIKFEKLFSTRYSRPDSAQGLYDFSFDNGSFYSLQRLVEKRASERGIDVLYVNPAYTSKRCSRCGNYGKRFRKRFECPHCGYIAHADVNAAFNIATTTRNLTIADRLTETGESVPLSKKQVRRLIRLQPVPGIAVPGIPVTAMTDLPCCENILAVLEY